MHTDMRSKAKERETVVEVGKLRSEPVDKTKKSGSISVESKGSKSNTMCIEFGCLNLFLKEALTGVVDLTAIDSITSLFEAGSLVE